MSPESPNPQFAFSDARQVARYAEGPPRMVPGFFDMHRMAHSCSPSESPIEVVCSSLGREVDWS